MDEKKVSVVKKEDSTDETSLILKMEQRSGSPSMIDLLPSDDIKAESESEPKSESHAGPSRIPIDEKNEQTAPAPSSIREEEEDKGENSNRGRSRSSAEEKKPSLRLINHLPRAEGAASKAYEHIKRNQYQNDRIGKSKGHKKESMVCECRHRPGNDDISSACTEESGCINRVTQVECLASDCNCGHYCQNRRFQKAQYAPMEIVQTEHKGFGLRAAEEIEADTFVAEYLGEIVEPDEFRRRMDLYRREGLRHFYFMMIQREEFLDATKKGGVARFMNHSCSPNCYVAKWHVGKYICMGIFAKRDIAQGEELSFNYNADRYGNDAQQCFCGEPNCVGSIGGKTQTDIGGMDQLFIDALGIADQVDRLEAKGSRRKKSRHLDEDFIPDLQPIQIDEVAKVVTAVRQATSLWPILQKLLSRIHMTQDTEVQRCLVRLHGFVLMADVIEEWKDDEEIVKLALGSLARWPLIARNKVVDSGIDRLVKDLSEGEEEEVNRLAKDLLSAWDALDMSYRIARKEANDAQPTASWLEPRRPGGYDDEVRDGVALQDAQAPNAVSDSLQNVVPRPLGTSRPLGGMVGSVRPATWRDSPTTPQTPDSSYLNTTNGKPPIPYRGPKPMAMASFSLPKVPKVVSIDDIIRQANESQAEQRRLVEEKAKAEQEEKMKREKERPTISSAVRKAKRASAGDRSGEKKKRAKADDGLPSGEMLEKRLKKLVGEIVVKVMSRYSSKLDKEVFKKHAKELTTITCTKEMRSSKSWPPKDDLKKGLSKEKKDKIKAFANDYTVKLVARRGKGSQMGSGTLSPSIKRSAVASSGDGGGAEADVGSHRLPHQGQDEDEMSLSSESSETASSDKEEEVVPSGVEDEDGSSRQDDSSATTATSFAPPATPQEAQDLIPAGVAAKLGKMVNGQGPSLRHDTVVTTTTTTTTTTSTGSKP